MSRAQTILQSEYPYSLGGRCINRDWFNLPMDLVWEIMSRHLHFLHHGYNFQIHCFLLMSNHFHMIAGTPLSNLSDGMAYFMRSTSRELTEAGNRINQTYGRRYFRTILGSHHYFLNSYKYIYRNPVRAGICSRIEDYPYSSMAGLIGRSRLGFPVVEDVTLFSDFEGTLHWLNQKPNEKNENAVKLALRRPVFRLPKPDGKNHVMETEIL